MTVGGMGFIPERLLMMMMMMMMIIGQTTWYSSSSSSLLINELLQLLQALVWCRAYVTPATMFFPPLVFTLANAVLRRPLRCWGPRFWVLRVRLRLEACSSEWVAFYYLLLWWFMTYAGPGLNARLMIIYLNDNKLKIICLSVLMEHTSKHVKQNARQEKAGITVKEQVRNRSGPASPNETY